MDTTERQKGALPAHTSSESDSRHFSPPSDVSKTSLADLGPNSVGTSQASKDAMKDETTSLPQIILPKGGGAIRGIEESFHVSSATGTASMSLPVPISKGRSGFTPQLNLSYDSGQGNGVFGFGWQLSAASVTRRTNKGLPLYRDAEESDLFNLSGAEDLIPLLTSTAGGVWQRALPDTRVVGTATYSVERYRPRVESEFSLIQKWTNLATGDIHWRSITKDNITSIYGRDNSSRIFDPNDPTSNRVFSWLICQSYDDVGNVIVYEYKAEDSSNIDLGNVSESNRTATDRSANRYLKSVKYGNKISFLIQSDLSAATWFFNLILDYGEHDAANPTPDDSLNPWIVRSDPFSSYRAGFEVRTYRLCQRMLMFHNFPGEMTAGTNCLVRSLNFAYGSAQGISEGATGDATASVMLSAVKYGYVRNTGGSGYISDAYPPLEFAYSHATLGTEIQTVDPQSLENLPSGLNNSYQWLDLDGEGVSGILTEQDDAWYYKHNIGNAQFGPLEKVSLQPNDASQKFLSLAGDGQQSLVQLKRPNPGFYKRTLNEGWEPFQVFDEWPILNWDDKNIQFLDMTGDGRMDVLFTETEYLYFYASTGESGFNAPQKIWKTTDENVGPAVVFSDAKHTIYTADMSGDGLPDIVRIRNGDISYWPNLGYGHFGRKITMSNAPWFDNSDVFDALRIRMGDIDGTGTTDLLYLSTRGVNIAFNQSGNSWSTLVPLENFPPVSAIDNVKVLDLLGNGTSCIVWSSPLPSDQGREISYVDLMGGRKPCLLERIKNGVGVEKRIFYAPSTKFYLEDKLAGIPWITHLPFPVQVVERLEVHDRISRNLFTSRYKYHHGYWDGVEREFQGFGMVETWDNEDLGALTTSGSIQTQTTTNRNPSSNVPPTLTKTWYHTGTYQQYPSLSKQFAEEYYVESARLTSTQRAAMTIDDSSISNYILQPQGQELAYSLTPEEVREAMRALKGSVLRRELYAIDGTAAASRPYNVTEDSYTVEVIQPQGGGSLNRYGSFFAHNRESAGLQYERKQVSVGGILLGDPRVTHTLTLATDEWGNVLQAVDITYGRRTVDTFNSQLSSVDILKQQQTRFLYHQSTYTNSIENQSDIWRGPLLCGDQQYELVKIPNKTSAPAITNLFRVTDLQEVVSSLASGNYDLDFQDYAATGATQTHAYRRLTNQQITLFRADNLSGPLPLGSLESLALQYQQQTLAFTPDLLQNVYVGSGKVSSSYLNGAMANDAYYQHNQGDLNWWSPSGTIFFSPGSNDSPATELAYAQAHFFRKCRYRDPFYSSTNITDRIFSYDTYDLLLQESMDPVGNRTTVGSRSVDPTQPVLAPGQDYRVLQPALVMDPNRNRMAFSFDALGLVVGSALMGKPEENKGDNLNGFQTILSDSDKALFFSNPVFASENLLANATSRFVYDLKAYKRTEASAKPQPIVAGSIVRETHTSDLSPGQSSRLLQRFDYSDGLGRVIQSKGRAAPGPVPQRDPSTGQVIVLNGQPAMTTSSMDPRWIGTGWKVYDNKGNVIRQFEPFFTDTDNFEFDLQIGVSPIMFYDPVGRKIGTVNADHSWSKIIFDSWQTTTWDYNDTVLAPDPSQDLDIGAYFAKLPTADYLPTWMTQYSVGSADYQDAASKTKAHASTPSLSFVDSLSHPILEVKNNRVVSSAGSTPTDVYYATRTTFDIEGHPLSVVDPKGRTAMSFDYDILGRQIHQSSMEAGDRWVLQDVAANPLYSWNSRSIQTRTSYDVARRAIATHMTQGTGPELMVEQTAYGESVTNPEGFNLRTKVYQKFDQAGVATMQDYDFKGSLLTLNRQFAQVYNNTLDFSSSVPLLSTVYTTKKTYDALSRVVSTTTPDSSITNVIYNEAELLLSIELSFEGSGQASSYISQIQYDAKKQKTAVYNGNGAITNYEYDYFTFRMTRTHTTRTTGDSLQDLNYTYDPMGNVTRVRENAQQTVYFDNQVVSASTDYTYDAVYRLVNAGGREHLGQASAPGNVDLPPIQDPRNGNAMGLYSEQYQYDEVGNILSVAHSNSSTSASNWTRNYTYKEPSQLEAGNFNNRLSSTTVGSMTESYSYDVHGNMTSMSGIPLMQWNYRDELQAISTQVVNSGTPQTTYYVYDANGVRARKVTERQASAGNTPTLLSDRIYLKGFEVYRRYQGDGTTIDLERQTLHIMDDRHRVALIETRTQGIDSLPVQLVRYQFNGLLESCFLELDDTGQIVSYEEYYPFGATSYQAVRADIEAKRYRYSGKEKDSESSLYYYGARYYAPWLGRWTSCDPGGFVDGPNLYVYVGCNPVSRSDPLGMQSVAAKPDDNVQSKAPSGEAQSIAPKEQLQCVPPGNQPQNESTPAQAPVPTSSPTGASTPSPPPPSPPSPPSATAPGGSPASPPGKPATVTPASAGAGATPAENRTFWSRGGGILAAGLVALTTSIVVLSFFTPIGWFGLLAAGMALSTGIAGTGVGLVSLAASYGGQTTAQQDKDLAGATTTTMTLAGSPLGLVGGTIGAMTTGTAEGVDKGAELPSSGKLAIGLGLIKVGTALYSRAPLTTSTFAPLAAGVGQYLRQSVNEKAHPDPGLSLPALGHDLLKSMGSSKDPHADKGVQSQPNLLNPVILSW